MDTVGGVQQTTVLGGGSLTVPEWSDFLREHYLAAYLPAGGAAVKMAVAGSGETAARLQRAVGAAADATGCLFVTVDAREVRVDQVQQLLFAVTRAVDWDALVAAVLRSAYDAAGMPAVAGLSVAEVAASYGLDPGELYRSVRRELEERLLRDPDLARDLGRAVLRLAQAELGRGDVQQPERDAVLGWLRGEKVPAALIRPASRIDRHNARHLLVSLARLLLSTGSGGLVLLLDLERLETARRPPVEQRDGLYYSKAAVLDAFEVLRQLIDATDDLRGVLVLAVVPPGLVTDETRGLPSYAALQLRVADEVRDRRRANPFAALVRLEVRLEAVT